jgi:hypothetical protein
MKNLNTIRPSNVTKSSTLALPEHELGELIALLRGTLASWIIGVLNKPCCPRLQPAGTRHRQFGMAAAQCRPGRAGVDLYLQRSRGFREKCWDAGRHGQSNLEIENASCVDQYG